MTDPIRQFIDAARGRCEKATKEPWTVIVEDCDDSGCERGEIFINEIERSFHSCEWADPKDWDRDEANAEFCAAARTDLPRALDTIDRLMQFVDHEDSLWGDPDNPAAITRADVARILAGEKP